MKRAYRQSIYGRRSEMRGLSFAERKDRFDLGLAIAGMHAVPGVPMPMTMLADFCGCTGAYIHQIEQRALRKLHHRLGPEREELRGLLESRRPFSHPKMHQHQTQ